MENKKGKKLFYKGLPVRWWNNKYWVIPKDGGAWKEYAGKISEIETEKEEVRKERFFKIEYSLLEKNCIGLNATDRIILIVLLSHKNENSNKIWPSISRISFLSGVSKKTIYKKLPFILKRFKIEKKRVFRSNNLYIFS